jgi:hypothetical protein
VLISLPGTTFRVGQGPYTVPLTIVNAARLSMLTLTLTYDPALLRVRAVQEGSFMRSGYVTTTFTQQVAAGRVDVTIARADDAGPREVLHRGPVDPAAPERSDTERHGTDRAMGLQFSRSPSRSRGTDGPVKHGRWLMAIRADGPSGL